MSTTSASHALAAFVRLLLHARAGGQAKVDALLALSQRTLYVPRKLDGEEGYATLVNEKGDWALPVFTSPGQLDAAADVFGWRKADRSVDFDEVGARRAVHYALNEGAAFMVIDATAVHALEAGRDELAPLVSTQNRSDTAGPFAGVGRISSSILEATRPSEVAIQGELPSRGSSPPPARVTRASFAPPRDEGAPTQRRSTVSFARTSRESEPAFPPPGTRRSSRPPEPDSLSMELSPLESMPALDLDEPPGLAPMPGYRDLPALDLEPPRMALPPTTAQRSTAPGVVPPASTLPPAAPVLRPISAPPAPPMEPPAADEAIQIRPLTGPADDLLLATLTEVLREFPEVEWATYSLASRGGRSAKHAVGLRVLDSFRANVPDITARVQAVGVEGKVALDVLLLDDPELVRSARQLGEVFYPWRRTTRA